ncbi:MAG: MerR family transcriptional regulator [Bryobacteraceae bacterium]
MAQRSISQIARQVGLRASAIRYYEQIGILEPAPRVSGQRRYPDAVVYRFAVVRRAQEAGFTLDEIRQLFFGFSQSTPVSDRWKRLALGKVKELDAKIEQIRSMRKLLKKLETCCECETVERCGAAILGTGRTASTDRVSAKGPLHRRDL